MRDLSIRMKLYSVTIIVTVVLVGLGALAVYSLGNVNDKSTELSKKWLPRVKLSGELNTLTSDYRIAQYNHIVAIAPKDMAEAEKLIEERRNNVEKSFAEYGKAITDNSRKAIFDRAHNEWQTYLKESERVITLSRQNKVEEAGTLMRGEMRDLFNKANNGVIEFTDYSQKGGDVASREIDTVYKTTIEILIGVIIVAIIITVVSLITITRRILGAIRILLTAVNKVADGDLRDLLEIKSSDEFGQLGLANNKMINNLKTLIAQIQKTSEQVAASSEELTASADQSADVTQTIAQAVTSVAEMSTKQVGAVNAASGIIETMSAGIEETAATVNVAADQTPRRKATNRSRRPLRR